MTSLVREVHIGDCLDVLAGMPAESVDAVITDPDYGIATAANPTYGASDFDPSGRKTGWQGWEVPYEANSYQVYAAVWGNAVFRVAKPGAWLAAFGYPKTIHRQTSGLEDAGWEIRHVIAQVHDQGNLTGVMKYSDHTGDPGWSNRLRGAYDAIVVARKPHAGSMGANWEQNRVGYIHVDACLTERGTWPNDVVYVKKGRRSDIPVEGSFKHTTPKSLPLCQWLVRLLTPPGGAVLDPFGGSGTTAEAAVAENRGFVLCEVQPVFVPQIEGRLQRAGLKGDDYLLEYLDPEVVKAAPTWNPTIAAPHVHCSSCGFVLPLHAEGCPITVND